MKNHNRTKIVATYGPACADKEVLYDMIKAGVNVIRFNFSHGTHEFHKNGFDLVRQINLENELTVAILVDLQGPKIRVGQVQHDQLELKAGSSINLSNENKESTKDCIYIQYDNLFEDLKVGETILIDDGKIELKITEAGKKLKAKVVNDGILSSKKGVNFPKTKTTVPSLTQKDLADLEFALQEDVNWVALSFVRSSYDVTQLRQLIGTDKPFTKVLAKIEKPEAMDELDDIIAVSDAIMVARGDLGVELPIEKMPLIQKQIVKKCIEANTPVVIATQMMESMINSPSPTRAEITDVANAVIDGADAVMLSAETSVGKYPIKVIETMAKIVKNIEKANLIYEKDLEADRKSPTFSSDVICHSAVKIAHDVNAKAIIGITVSGYTAFMLSSNRPKAKIFIFTRSKKMLYTLNILWGVKAYYYDKSVDTDSTISDLIKILKSKKHLEAGDYVVNCASMPLEAKGRTNMVKITEVS